jgi:hypothetical protein
MTRYACILTVALVAGLFTSIAHGESVCESARDIPVAYDVDVVVVGGSSGAVAAAVEAAKQGASVFLAAPKTYLGEDLCATYRLWLEPGEEPVSPLAKAIFAPPRPAFAIEKGLPFTYKTDPPSSGVHKDTQPPTLLADGKAANAPSQSVEYGGDVTLVLDLGKETALNGVHLLAFQRANDFEVQAFSVRSSVDAEHWGPATEVQNALLGKSSFENNPLHLQAVLSGNARYLKVSVTKAASAKRLLLGEIVVEDASAKVAAPAADAPRVPPMPMQVKRTLDEALLQAGVSFLYGCYPTDVLFDASGQPAGIVMANRSGRQAVRGKVIIDATTRAVVARMAGAQFEAYPQGAQGFQRIVAGGKPLEALHPKSLPAPLQLEQEGATENTRMEAAAYSLSLPMRDGSFASFAEAEQKARDLTWTIGQAVTSENLFQVPPDAMHARKHVSDVPKGGDTLDLDVFRPKEVGRLYVLGGCADVPRETAAQMLRPLALLDLGTRIGSAAAAEAKGVAKTGDVHLAAASPDQALPGEVRETLTGVRPTQTGLPTVHADARALPVLGSYDVVVVGGGTGGAPAGISAARQGAKTLVIEYLDGLGGVGTLGLIGSYYYGVLEGFTKELDAGVASLSAEAPKNKHAWNVEAKMEWYRRELRKAGAEIWFGAMGCGALTENNRVTGVVVATPDGRGVLLAKTVIDATGNADIAAAAGAECMATGAAHVAVQGTGMPPYKPGENYTNTDYTLTDDTDVTDAWRTFLAGRDKYRDAFDLAPIIDSRERRRIVGDFILSPLDIWNKRTYPDTIGLSRSNFDTHGFTVHALFALRAPDKEAVSAYTPLRALLPKGLDGILVTGLGISAHRDAMPILRMQADIQNQGYAAGAAAAMAVKSKKALRDIDIKALQQHLVQVGNLPESVLTDTDAYPYSLEQIKGAVAKLADGYDGISVVLAQPEEALPLLRDSYRDATTEEGKRVYAHVLGMLGDPAGAATLAEAVANTPWDHGWSFTGGGQYGMSLSPLDSQIVALARTYDPRAAEIIAAKARTLDANSEFSHHRAVAIALGTLGRAEAADALAELLHKPGMTGYACTDIAAAKRADELPNANLDRDRSIRELLLARALYRCGDHDGFAAGILQTYARDLGGYLAKHAQAILANTSGPSDAAGALDIETASR